VPPIRGLEKEKEKKEMVSKELIGGGCTGGYTPED